MYALSKQAQAIFHAIISKLNDENENHFKYDSESGYMPLSVEFLYQNRTGKVYSLCHYGEMNGDLMKDPDMTFLVYPSGFVYPYEYQNDYLGKYEKALEFDEVGNIAYTSPKLCKSMTTFANLWMQNIKEQQNIETNERETATAH